MKNSLSLLLLALGLLPAVPAPAAPANDTLVYCSEASPSSLNPILTMDGASVDLLVQVYESLTALDPKTGEAIPRLATKWTAAKDGKSFVFELRKDV